MSNTLLLVTLQLQHAAFVVVKCNGAHMSLSQHGTLRQGRAPANSPGSQLHLHMPHSTLA
jgi:hypothetical protein